MRPGGRSSLTLRLTLLFAAVSTTVLLLLGLLVGALAERHFEDMDKALLEGKLDLLRHALHNVRSAPQLEALPGQLDDALVGHQGLSVRVLAPGGEILYSSGDAGFPESLLATAPRQSAVPAVWSDVAGHRFRGLAVAARTGIPDVPPAVVAVATDISVHEHFMHAFRWALWSAVGAAALLSGFLGWIAAWRGLAPLKAMRRSAADITANRLDQRLPAAAIPAELAEVADTLNAMLGRLQEAFQRLSEFSSDLAHELRTPLSNLLTQTQVTLSKPRTSEDYQEVLASNAEELERLARTIADMLFLAKADNELAIPQREQVDLGQEIGGLFEFYEALAEERGIGLSREGEGRVSGDRLMLRRALNNLLSNALRHTPSGGHIVVRIGRPEASTVTLSVENTGQTIAPQHLPRLFDRFYRVAASRHGPAEGAGLGLAITKSIVSAHGGEIDVRSEADITTFNIRLPAEA